MKVFVKEHQDRFHNELLAKCDEMREKEHREHKLLLNVHEKDAQECEREARVMDIQRQREVHEKEFEREREREEKKPELKI